MIEIIKGSEPEGLAELREECRKKGLSPKKSFDELKNPLKEQVLQCLKRDQGNLCVYCMCRIPRKIVDPGIKGQTIEHFVPLEPEDGRDIGQGLDYQNLFAVCHGNTKWHKRGTRRTTSKKDLTCDKHRGNAEFRKIDPRRKETLSTIKYHYDGRIDADDPDVRFDLQETLNLNSASAPQIYERKAALDGLIEDIMDLRDEQLRTYLKERLRLFESESGMKTPYAGMLIWFLRSRLGEGGKPG